MAIGILAPTRSLTMYCGYYVLFRLDGVVKAGDATVFGGNCFPSALVIGDRVYRRLISEDTFFFWDELIDGDGRTVGFSLVLPESPSFRQSRLLRESSNVALELNGELAIIDLSPGTPHNEDDVQGFGSEVYWAEDGPADCAIVMMNWSDRQAGFDLTEEVVPILA